jgi:hypothetical protein
MSPNPDTVCQLLNQGWSVTYSIASISFSCDHRSIRVHDSGHVEAVDIRDRLSAPSRHDPVWKSALNLLGIDLDRLEFNPFLARWAYPLGAGRIGKSDRAVSIRPVVVRSARR